VVLQGQFDLNELRVGEGAVLRRSTRLLSGASMDSYAMMLENTLVVSGDVLGAGSVWQVCLICRKEWGLGRRVIYVVHKSTRGGYQHYIK
jgi:hypothetical protein